MSVLIPRAARRIRTPRSAIAGAFAIAARGLAPAALIMHKPTTDPARDWACHVCGLAVAHHAKAWRRFMWRLTRRSDDWGQW